MSLIVKRKANQGIVIDGPAVVRVVEIHGNYVSLLVNADDDVRIRREEKPERIEREAESEE